MEDNVYQVAEDVGREPNVSANGIPVEPDEEAERAIVWGTGLVSVRTETTGRGDGMRPAPPRGRCGPTARVPAPLVTGEVEEEAYSDGILRRDGRMAAAPP